MRITLAQQLDILARAIENAGNEADESASIAYREKPVLADMLYTVSYDLRVALAAVKAVAQKAQRRELSDAEHEANIRALEDARERDEARGADAAYNGKYWDGEKWARIELTPPGALFYMSPCCSVGLIEVEAAEDNGLIIECACGWRYSYERGAWLRTRSRASVRSDWEPVTLPVAFLADPEAVAAYEAAQDTIAIPVMAPAKCRAEGCGWVGLASSSDCPSCGSLALSGATFDEIEAAHERESLRRQRVNFNAIADGLGPIYPDEY